MVPTQSTQITPRGPLERALVLRMVVAIPKPNQKPLVTKSVGPKKLPLPWGQPRKYMPEAEHDPRMGAGSTALTFPVRLLTLDFFNFHSVWSTVPNLQPVPRDLRGAIFHAATFLV